SSLRGRWTLPGDQQTLYRGHILLARDLDFLATPQVTQLHHPLGELTPAVDQRHAAAVFARRLELLAACEVLPRVVDALAVGAQRIAVAERGASFRRTPTPRVHSRPLGARWHEPTLLEQQLHGPGANCKPNCGQRRPA